MIIKINELEELTTTKVFDEVLKYYWAFIDKKVGIDEIVKNINDYLELDEKDFKKEVKKYEKQDSEKSELFLFILKIIEKNKVFPEVEEPAEEPIEEEKPKLKRRTTKKEEKEK